MTINHNIWQALAAVADLNEVGWSMFYIDCTDAAGPNVFAKD